MCRLPQPLPPLALLRTLRGDNPGPMQERDCAALSNTRGFGLDAAMRARNLQRLETLLLPHPPPVQFVAAKHRCAEEREPSESCDNPLYLTENMHRGSTRRASVAHQIRLAKCSASHHTPEESLLIKRPLHTSLHPARRACTRLRSTPRFNRPPRVHELIKFFLHTEMPLLHPLQLSRRAHI